MRRYFKISLLLLLFEPLFIWNVFAQEIDSDLKVDDVVLLDKTDDELLSTEIDQNDEATDINQNDEATEINQNDDSIEINQNDEATEINQNDDVIDIQTIVDSLPSVYQVDKNEDELVSHDSDTFKMLGELEVEKLIQEYLDGNQMDLSKYGYSYYVTCLYDRVDKTMSDYVISFYTDDNEDVYEKDIHVNYLNSGDYNEEDSEKVIELLKNQDHLVVDNYYDFYTKELIGDHFITMNDYLDEIVENSDIHYIYENMFLSDQEFSMEEYGYAYFFVNHVFYRCVPTIMNYTSRITISPQVTRDDVIGEVREQADEIYEVDFPVEEIQLSVDDEVYREEEYRSFGRISIYQLPSEKVEKYSVVGGNNAIVDITQSSKLSIQIDCPYIKFIKLYINGVEVHSKYYDVSKDNMVITLNDEFIRSLSKSKYSFLTRFSDGDASGFFTISESERVVVSEPYIPSYPVYYYTYSESDNLLVETQELKEEKEASVISNEVVKKEENNIKETLEEDVKEVLEVDDESGNRFNMNSIPIIIVALAFVFGAFGGFLYKKSLED